MTLENLTAREEILSFCDFRILQLMNERKKVLDQCEDEFKYEINTRFSAKIEEIEHIKNTFEYSGFEDVPEADLKETGRKIYSNV